MNRKQSGFTLVEIAIVLVIIGLLLGGILKGQELINSARVRSMAEMNSGIQAAYYGFVDRYRRIPGDMLQAEADTAIAEVILGGGNGNGRHDGANPWTEAAALWEHLSKSGFLQGSYTGTAADETSYTSADSAPQNPFNGFLVLFRTTDYQVASGTASNRLNLVLGRSTPVDIARELDVKVDDGRPLTGILRLGLAAAGTFGAIPQTEGTCLLTGANDYDVPTDSQDCNSVFLY